MASGKPVTAPDDTSELFTLGPATINQMRDQSLSLLDEHYDELATDKDVMRLSPNWKKYYELEERDMIAGLGAWLGSEMVGYSMNLVFQHLHYQDLKVLQNDVLFVAKNHRDGGVGLKLIEATEELGRVHECDMILWHSKVGTALGVILERRGYKVQDVIQSKAL